MIVILTIKQFGKFLAGNDKNAALYPLQADVRDRSQLFTFHFPNDSFQNHLKKLALTAGKVSMLGNCPNLFLFNTYFTSVVPTALLLQCNWPITGIRRVL